MTAFFTEFIQEASSNSLFCFTLSGANVFIWSLFSLVSRLDSFLKRLDLNLPMMDAGFIRLGQRMFMLYLLLVFRDALLKAGNLF
jgi:hypothetical protein